jgi:hypothetical protein
VCDRPQVDLFCAGMQGADLYIHGEIGTVVLLTFTAGMSYVLSCGVGPRDLLWLIAVFGAVSGGILLLIWTVIGLLLTGSPEEEIEKELQWCMKTSNAKRE